MIPNDLLTHTTHPSKPPQFVVTIVDQIFRILDESKQSKLIQAGWFSKKGYRDWGFLSSNSGVHKIKGMGDIHFLSVK